MKNQKSEAPKTERYFCGVCFHWFRSNEPHTDPRTGEDCHEKCCPYCHPQRAGKSVKNILTNSVAPKPPEGT